MQKLHIGYAEVNAASIYVYLNIGSWPTMQKVRQALSRWLPDLPTWRSSDHWVGSSYGGHYFKNNFKWDGEYQFYFPLEAKRDIEQILSFR